jgi:hypothetical protein
MNDVTVLMPSDAKHEHRTLLPPPTPCPTVGQVEIFLQQHRLKICRPLVLCDVIGAVTESMVNPALVEDLQAFGGV